MRFRPPKKPYLLHPKSSVQVYPMNPLGTHAISSMGAQQS